jgi:hypothetical protein
MWAASEKGDLPTYRGVMSRVKVIPSERSHGQPASIPVRVLIRLNSNGSSPGEVRLPGLRAPLPGTPGCSGRASLSMWCLQLQCNACTIHEANNACVNACLKYSLCMVAAVPRVGLHIRAYSGVPYANLLVAWLG